MKHLFALLLISFSLHAFAQVPWYEKQIVNYERFDIAEIYRSNEIEQTDQASLVVIYALREFKVAKNERRAIEILDSARKVHPDSSIITYVLADMYSDYGDLDMSKQIYEELAAMPYASKIEKFYAYDALAFYAYYNQDAEEERKLAWLAYHLDSTYFGGIAGVARMYSHEGMYDSASFYYERAIANCDNPNIFNNFAMNLQRAGDFERSVDVLHRGLEVPSLSLQNRSIIYNNMAYALLKLDRPIEALAFVESSIRSNPDNSYAHRNKAHIHIYLNEMSAACNELERARDLGFENFYGPEVNKLIDENCD